MMIDGAIFDVDGTLLDSMEIWDGLGERYLIANGIRPEEGFNSKIKNMSLYESACYVKNKYAVSKSVQEILAEINCIVGVFYKYEVKLKAGAYEFLQMLSEKKVRMCVATAGSSELVIAAFERNNILNYFDTVIACDNKFRSKDKPDIYIASHNCLGTDIGRTWVFEDAVYAAKTAKSAGFKVAGIYDKSEIYHKELEQVSDVYFNSFSDAFSYFL